MSSASGFHFVNPDNGSATGHKAKTKARAFVARKSRADWSTKSNNKNDRRKLIRKLTRSMSHKPAQFVCRSSGRIVSADSSSSAENNRVINSQTLRGYSSHSLLFLEKQPEACKSCGTFLAKSAILATTGACPLCAGSLISEVFNHRLPAMDGLLCPYGSAAVTVEPSCMGLLAFFNAAISQQISSAATRPLQASRHYITALLNNSACMYAFLCLTALQLGTLQYDRRAEHLLQAMHFRLQAVTAIQDNLSDIENAASDENIAAVFSLLCVEENLFLPAFDDKISGTQLRPDHAQRLAHMNGLKSLIKMRGGVMSLGNSRGLQMFLIRHSAVQAAVSFEPSYFLPPDSLSRVFHYPDSPLHPLCSCPMAAACATNGMNMELVEIIRSAECLMHDTAAWYKNPETLKGGRDLLEIQNLFSVIISRFVQWHVENSSTCTPVEGVISVCLVIFMCFVMRGRHTVYGPLPSCLFRLKPYFDDPNILRELRHMSFDVWVGLLLVIGSASHHDLEDHFFRIYLQIIYDNDIQTFNHLMERLKAGIWISRPMTSYAWEIWIETPELVKRSAKMSHESCGQSMQAEDMKSFIMQRKATTSAQRPVSLLGFPAFKLDHTDSPLFQE